MSPTMWLPWQRLLPSNGVLNILQSWASGGRTREPILMKFGMQQQVRTAMTVMRSSIKIFKIQNGGRPPCWKYIRNVITRLPVDRLGRNLGGHIPSFPDMSAMMWLPWQWPWQPHHGGHVGDMAHWTFCSYGRLEAERVNQFWWYSEHNSTLGSQWQSRDQILKFLKFKRADGCHVGKYWKYHNSPSNWTTLFTRHLVEIVSSRKQQKY